LFLALTVLLLLSLLLLLLALLSVASLAACSKHEALDAFKKEVNKNAFEIWLWSITFYNLSG